MVRIIIIAVFLMLTVKGAQAQIKKFQDIAGTWNIVGEPGISASLQIIDSSTIVLTYRGEKRIITNYTIDFSKSPCWFDFSTRDSTSVLQVKSLVQKIGDDVLQWQLFVDEERSPYFTNYKGELLYLKKTKPESGGVIAVAH
jgi:hypothetical protein